MFFLTLATTALLSHIVMAAPMASNAIAARQTYPNVPVTFNGAGGTYYNTVIVANDVSVPTGTDMSVVSISMFGRADFTCSSHGVDGSVTFLVGDEQNVAVNPPQIQTSISCSAPPES
ncbi:hypothetical protein B7494_g7036 [Chlorociboria aeruginascens]|nr:hypothetical protein B7494_g7036 [Chlorociboria aeruginascens]